MNDMFQVRGLNWEVSVLVNSEVFEGNEGYFEAVTKVFEHLYRDANQSEILKVRLLDGDEDISPEGFSVASWKLSEGFLPAPTWGEYLLVKKLGDTEYTGVKADQVLTNAGLLEFLHDGESTEQPMYETE